MIRSALEAWDLTRRSLAYSNHTLLPEALEKCPVRYFEQMVPRHLEIIYEINRRFLDDVRRRYPVDEQRVARVSLFEEGPQEKVRMANLAIVGSHSTNGVAAIHSELLRTVTVKDLAEIGMKCYAFPDLGRVLRDCAVTEQLPGAGEIQNCLGIALRAHSSPSA